MQRDAWDELFRSPKGPGGWQWWIAPALAVAAVAGVANIAPPGQPVFPSGLAPQIAAPPVVEDVPEATPAPPVLPVADPAPAPVAPAEPVDLPARVVLVAHVAAAPAAVPPTTTPPPPVTAPPTPVAEPTEPIFRVAEEDDGRGRGKKLGHAKQDEWQHSVENPSTDGHQGKPGSQGSQGNGAARRGPKR